MKSEMTIHSLRYNTTTQSSMLSLYTTVHATCIFRWLCRSVVLILCLQSLSAQTAKYDTNAVIITRAISRDLFDLNSIPFMEPMVRSINATSNARFFTTVEIPKEDSFYVRIGVHGMMGFVGDDLLSYSPQVPTRKTPINLGDYSRNGGFDTNQLAVDLTKRLLQLGIDSGRVKVPARAATIFGLNRQNLDLNPQYLDSLLSNHPEFALFKILPEAQRDVIKKAILGLPTQLALPSGQNLRTLYAFVPQIEIGSYLGTEIMIRGIPPIKLDSSIGKFSFWGVALRHNISRYWKDAPVNFAFQIGYQSTYLKNTIGATNSELEARADFLNINIHASKKIEGWFDIYSGFSVEKVQIAAGYSYVLPQEVQISLGLLGFDKTTGEVIRDASQGYPGDNVVQTSKLMISNTNIKWTIGVQKTLGPIALFADYSLSQFNILSGGLTFRF